MVVTWPAWEIFLGGDAGLPEHYDRTRLFVCVAVFHTAVYFLMQRLGRGWSTLKVCLVTVFSGWIAVLGFVLLVGGSFIVIQDAAQALGLHVNWPKWID
jgi:hypothetical protein